MGRTLDNAMLNVGMKDVAKGMYSHASLLLVIKSVDTKVRA